MTVAGRIATSTALLVLFLVAALSYHLGVVRRLVATNRALASDKVDLVVRALDQARAIDGIEESIRKLTVTGDPGYAEQLEARRREFADGLERLERPSLAPAERSAFAALETAWEELDRALPAADAWLSVATTLERARLAQAPLGLTAGLRAGARRLVGTANDELEVESERAAAALDESERLALLLFALATASGIVAVVLATRAIQRPLRRLIAATGEVGEQNFVTVDASGDDEFARLGRAFNRMAARLAEVDEMKRNLLSHVSHELRTPLANLQEGTQLMLDDLAGPLTAEQRHLLDLNLASGRRLERMIDQLLERSRIDAGVATYDFDRHDAAEIAAAVVAENAGRAAESGRLLVADLPAPLVVACDREALFRIVQNLVDNALKFTPAGGRIEVRTRALDAPPGDLPDDHADLAGESGGFALIEVDDEGPGVAASEREAIFRRFYRSERGRGGPPGVGLGLAICRDLVEAHGGAIWVADHAPVGATFRVLLPVGSTRLAAPSATPVDAGADA